MLDIAGFKDPAKFHFYKGKGCSNCFQTGYKGRTGVFEILTMNSKLRDAINSGLSSTDLRKVIAESGDFVSMLSNARELAAKGVTTVDEVVREVATIE